MSLRSARCLPALAGLLLAVGCLDPLGYRMNATVGDLSARPVDLQPLLPADQKTVARRDPAVVPAAHVAQEPGKGKEEGKAKADEKPGGAEDLPPRPPRREPYIPPALLPGGPVGPLLPKGLKGAELKKAIAALYPPLPPLGEDVSPPPGPEGRPLTLADLQRLALANSPQVRQAVAAVEAARGAALQAGLPPNPTAGYEGDTMGTAGGAGYQGGFVEQLIKTAGKLQLARAVATMDLRNAEVALRRARADLATRVRGGYFAVLVAQESVRVNRALVEFTTETYRIQVGQVRRGGFAAAYEPLYLRALAMQARAGLVQARNAYTSAWKQLAAALGLPGMPPTQLAGRVDMPIPVFDHREVLARVLARHTDVLTAGNSYQQAILQLKQEEVKPIPDVDVRVMLQKDRTGPPFEISPSVQVSMPLPVWDRNQGGIYQAQANVGRMSEEAHRVRAELTRTLAAAFQRYEDNRVLLGYYRDRILPDLVRVYRGVWERYQQEAGIAPPLGAPSPPTFSDVVVAQQNLATSVGTYLTTLGALWQAVVDVADLLQTDDLFHLGVDCPVPTEPVLPIPDLAHLPPLPCDHPCSPLPGLHQKVLDPEWPPADPAQQTHRPGPAPGGSGGAGQAPGGKPEDRRGPPDQAKTPDTSPPAKPPGGPRPTALPQPDPLLELSPPPGGGPGRRP